jgi:hypothetical protein
MRILTARGRVLSRRMLGLLHAGDNRVGVRLPRRYRGGTRVVFDAQGSDARAVVTVAPRRHSCSAAR